ncbi:MAG: TetR/AcrR family transcriptional regulator of autoinduction and epiphytic fitness [Gammaproteobacteria bacterium]|jgi:TetR/AcrR family transcriptional regulator of autoinduction and epiphytic fitness
MARGRPNKKQQIITLATPLFLENGFRATSIDQVVKLSNISKPTIYNHFPDKTQLFQHVLNNQTDALVEQWLSPNFSNRENQLSDVLLKIDCLEFYRLMIAEGRLVKNSVDYFNANFDSLWKEDVRKKDADFVRFWSNEILVPYLLYQIDLAAISGVFQEYLTRQSKKP